MLVKQYRSKDEQKELNKQIEAFKKKNCFYCKLLKADITETQCRYNQINSTSSLIHYTEKGNASVKTTLSVCKFCEKYDVKIAKADKRRTAKGVLQVKKGRKYIDVMEEPEDKEDVFSEENI